MNWAVERVGTVASTMEVIREMARQGAPEGTCLVAEEMSAGRGTHGRTWHAPKGGLYLSFILRGLSDPHMLTLALGNAVAEVLEVAGVDARLKWVNDVWADGKKIAGILVEMESTGDKVDFAIAGIGINVNGHAADFPKGLRDEATTLEDQLHCDSCIPDLEAVLFEAVESWVEKVRQKRDGEVVAAYRLRELLVGRKVRLEEAGPVVEGTAQGIDDKGRLRVNVGGKVAAFSTGSVRLLD